MLSTEILKFLPKRLGYFIPCGNTGRTEKDYVEPGAALDNIKAPNRTDLLSERPILGHIVADLWPCIVVCRTINSSAARLIPDEQKRSINYRRAIQDTKAERMFAKRFSNFRIVFASFFVDVLTNIFCFFR
ncbi:hypothetical protein GLUCORHAEAF1_15745 [Komagataeibacter rhaeticus AF1]|nr:hypothetical protein GLUCORHAEAF1_15745 [Komagataeibacter rhaeticus AF1]